MIARENRALSEWIRDRCKRTGIGKILLIAKPLRLQQTYCDNIPLLFFCYEPLSMSLRGFCGRLFIPRLNQRKTSRQTNSIIVEPHRYTHRLPGKSPAVGPLMFPVDRRRSLRLK